MTILGQKKIRVVLADDHPLLLTGFSAELTNSAIEVIATVRDPEVALATYREAKADVLILDIRFGEAQSGLDTALHAIERDSSTRVVLLTQFDQSSVIARSYKGGVLAYVTKNVDIPDLVAAIKAAAEGRQYFIPAIAQRLAREAVDPHTVPINMLSDRERDVLRLISQGLTNQQIADELKVSAKTVSNDSAEVKRKLGISRTAQLTLYASRNGLL